MFRDEAEEKFLQINALIFKGKLEQACESLKEARTDAVDAGYSSEAAFFSNVLGSLLSSQEGSEESSLDAYIQAEALEPLEARWKLSVANFLLNGFEKPGEALSKGREALSLGSTPHDLHGAHSIVGLALLRLGEEDGARNHFNQSAAPEIIGTFAASSCDLRLAEGLLRSVQMPATVPDYLQLVLEKARYEEDHSTLERVDKLLNEIGEVRSSG